MRTLAFSLLLAVLLAGCATTPAVPPLSAADVIALAKEGKDAQAIIAELKRTSTVLELRASDYVALHEAGVPDEVLNYLQLAQLDEVRWRERSLYWYGYGPGWGGYYGRWGPCPWRYGYRWGC